MSDHSLLVGIFTILLCAFVVSPWLHERQQRRADRARLERERQVYLEWWERTGRQQQKELADDIERLAERQKNKTWLQEAYAEGAEAASTGNAATITLIFHPSKTINTGTKDLSLHAREGFPPCREP